MIVSPETVHHSTPPGKDSVAGFREFHAVLLSGDEGRLLAIIDLNCRMETAFGTPLVPDILAPRVIEGPGAVLALFASKAGFAATLRLDNMRLSVLADEPDWVSARLVGRVEP